MTSSASSLQLKAYVEHQDKRAGIRSRIDEAKATSDYDGEWQARQELHDYWKKLPELRTEAIKSYGGDEARLGVDMAAYRLLRTI